MTSFSQITRRMLLSSVFCKLWSSFCLAFSRLSARQESYPSVIKPLALHILGLIIFCFVIFRNSNPLLFDGVDGNYFRILVRHQHDWMNLGLSLTSNPFQGLGNIFITLNSYMYPGYLLASVFSGGNVDPIVCYTIISVELFLSQFLMWCCFRIRLDLCFAASWSSTLLMMPFFYKHSLYTLTRVVPHAAEMLASTYLIVTCFYLIGKGRSLHSLTLSAVAFFVFVIMVTGNPSGFILVLPILLLLGIFVLIVAECRKELLLKVAFVGLLFAFSLPTLIPFVVGNFMNSVPAFFARELVPGGPPSWQVVVSILFHGGFSVQNLSGPVVFLLSFSGAAIGCILGVGLFRRLAIINIIFSATILAYGALLNFFLKGWIGPASIYFEFFMWPFYILFATFALTFALDLATALSLRVLEKVDYKVAASLKRRIHGRTAFIVILILCIAAIYDAAPSKDQRSWKFPPVETSLIRTLRSEIQLLPNSQFRGSVATYTGFSDQPPGIGWYDQHKYDGELYRKVGNEHRFNGLWYYDIPTLFEYNQLMSPQFYSMMSRLLSRPSDKQQRSVIVITLLNQGYLRSLGVKFLVTDFPLPADTCLREKLQWNTSRYLYLYELPSPNLGTYSPTRCLVAGSAQQVLEHITSKEFDFEKDVVIDFPPMDNLVKASSSSLNFLKGGTFRISATSDGTSMLLLPLQFSHCLDLEVIKSGEGNGVSPKLIRANLMQTGLIFSGSIDANITFGCGPLRNPCCRIRDALSMRKLDISSLQTTRAD